MHRKKKLSVLNLKKSLKGVKLRGLDVSRSAANEFHGPPEDGKNHSVQMILVNK